MKALSNVYFSSENEVQFLALCPLCAAMYREFVKLDESAMKDLNQTLKNSEKPEVSLNLGEIKTSVRFIESHWLDIKTILQEKGYRALHRTVFPLLSNAAVELGR